MLTVHIISDSIGNTAKDVVDAALVQFSYENKKYKVLKNSNVCTKEKIDCIISNVNEGDVIVQTLVDGALASYVKEKGLEKNIKVIDLLSEILSTFEEKTSFKLNIRVECLTFSKPPIITFPTLCVGEFFEISSGLSTSIFFSSENSES